jgi:hypothetical protein
MGTLGLDMDDKATTDFLFAMPCPLFGVARLIDLGAQFDSYNVSATPEEADALALLCDLRIVGKDFRVAISQANEERSSAGTSVR